MAVAYNKRPHYYFRKVVKKAERVAVKSSFLRQLSTNKFCWPNEPVMEGVEVEQVFQWNIITEVVAEPNTFTFLVIGDITTKFS